MKILPVSLDLGNTEVPASTPSAPSLNTSTTWTTHQDNKRSRKENTISSFPVWNCRNSYCVTGRFGAKRREALGNTALLLKQGNCWNASTPNIPGIWGTYYRTLGRHTAEMTREQVRNTAEQNLTEETEEVKLNMTNMGQGPNKIKQEVANTRARA